MSIQGARLLSGKVKRTLPGGGVEFVSLEDTEKNLGLPASNNYVLVSTTDGVRSWVSPEELFEGFSQSSISYTSSNTDPQVFTSFTTTIYRTAHYKIQLTSGTDYHTIQLSLIHDGTTVYLVQYGEIFDNVSLATFDASIASTTLSLSFTPTNAVTSLKALATLIKL